MTLDHITRIIKQTHAQVWEQYGFFLCFYRKQTKVGKKPVDTGGGFLVEEDEEGEMEQKIVHPPGKFYIIMFCALHS